MPMGVTERLALLVTADVDDAVRGLNKVGREADRSMGKADARIDQVGTRFTKVGASMLGAGALAAAGLWKAAGAASDLNEATSQSEQIFGAAAASVGEFAEGATAIGQSERAAREAANTFGLFFTNAGKSADEAARMSIELTELASDAASFKNTTPERAVEAFGAALRGESEPIRQYGVMLDDATLKQRALDMGLIETTTGTLPPAIKQQAAYAEILEQTSTIQGDYERTSEGAANKQRELSAQMENFKAALGEGVLPVMQEILSGGSSLVGWFNDVNEATDGGASKVAAYGTGLLLVGGALSTVTGQVIKARDNFGKLNSAMGRNSARLGVAAGAVAVGATAWKLYTDAQERHNRVSTETKARIVELDDAVGGLNESVDAEVKGFDTFRGTLVDAGVSTDDMAEALRGTDDAFETFRDNAVESALAAGASFNEMQILEHQLDQLRKGYDDGSEALEEHHRLQNRNADGAHHLEENLGTLRGEVEAVTDEVSDMGDELDKLFDDTFSVDQATRGWFDALEDLQTGLEDAAGDMSILSEKGRDNQAAFEDAVEAGNDYLVALQENGSSSDELRSAQGLLRDSLEITGAQFGLTRDEVDRYIGALGNVPTALTTNVELRYLDGGGPDARIRRQSGGPIPGSSSQPVPIIAHGGEYVLDAGTVDAIKRGEPSKGSATGTNMKSGGGLTLVVPSSGSIDARTLVETLREAERQGLMKVQVTA